MQRTKNCDNHLNKTAPGTSRDKEYDIDSGMTALCF